MSETLFPRVQSHAHYPAFLLDIAAKVPPRMTKRVFENWDKYAETNKKAGRAASAETFKKVYNYDVVLGSV